MKLEVFSDDMLQAMLRRDSGVLINHLATATMFDASAVAMLLEIGKQAIADELARRELLQIKNSITDVLASRYGIQPCAAENVPVATENFVFQDDGNASDRYASETRPDDEKDYHEFSMAPISSELVQQIAEADADLPEPAPVEPLPRYLCEPF